MSATLLLAIKFNDPVRRPKPPAIKSVKLNLHYMFIL